VGATEVAENHVERHRTKATAVTINEVHLPVPKTPITFHSLKFTKALRNLISWTSITKAIQKISNTVHISM
jgi:hypothetical protein